MPTTRLGRFNPAPTSRAGEALAVANAGHRDAALAGLGGEVGLGAEVWLGAVPSLQGDRGTSPTAGQSGTDTSGLGRSSLGQGP
jgi:hypothetical protein